MSDFEIIVQPTVSRIVEVQSNTAIVVEVGWLGANIVYGTADPPPINTVKEGTLFVRYTP